LSFQNKLCKMKPQAYKCCITDTQIFPNTTNH
jgi:hypothetical protein